MRVRKSMFLTLNGKLILLLPRFWSEERQVDVAELYSISRYRGKAYLISCMQKEN